MSEDRPSLEGLGPNAGLVEELYRQYLEDPDSVGEGWRDYFADYVPHSEDVDVGAPPPRAQAPQVPVVRTDAEPPDTPPSLPAGGESAELRGAAVRVVENMEASLGVPTATSVRTVPAKLLEVNRRIINNQLQRTGRGKISFTHLIGYAVTQALTRVPAMNASFRKAGGKPTIVRYSHVNLGLAVDVEKRDGTRSLVVPNIKQAEQKDFNHFVAAYEELIRRVRGGEMRVSDFTDTTATITNPGMIGTVHSVPRLMQGQGVIVGVGSIGNPPGYEGADPDTVARLGVGKVLTLTSTYDHRIIQGAVSGEFLAWIHRYLLGEDDFYDHVFRSLAVPYEPARWTEDVSPPEESLEGHAKSVRVQQLINLYRVRGHLIAHLDPLDRDEPKTHAELDPNQHGLTIWDLDRVFPTPGLGGGSMPLRDVLRVLRDAYARTVGLEYMHIQEMAQKVWIQARAERAQVELPRERKRRILERLNAAEAFETFLHTKFLGHKRFGIEGAESVIPMLDGLLEAAADAGVEEVVIGMAHRGRLNVLANVLGKSYREIFREFEGELDPQAPQGSGDVKYHLGAEGRHEAEDTSLRLTLASNPSHLEAVDPVVEGMVRARQDELGDLERKRVLPVLIHGDAAFAGQGVVAETLNLSELPGYEVGGTVHLVINNQLGFTTMPQYGRSSVYPTDVAKMVQAPIFHVNGDDPEACVRVVGLAFAFRSAFKKDVVVDMVCYRRHGHNEGDEPAFTQPRMYAAIEAKRSVRKLYAESLVNRGDITVEEAEATFADFRSRLDEAFEQTDASAPGLRTLGRHEAPPDLSPITTAVERSRLEQVITALTTHPPEIAPHPKLERQLQGRIRAFEGDAIDWALGEALALGSLVAEGVPVRLAGQDTRRGTFSQRHAVIVDHRTEAEHVSLAHVSPEQAPFMVYDSLLSEYAALGFEYGYSVARPQTLVCWEAQFGDFVNGAQIIIDQFIATAEDKWSQRSALTLLLPHGYDGQGPEHSSARLERFLILCAENNLRIVYPTTSAQYFHALRRQIHAPEHVPLVCFTPKRYLRMPETRCAVADFTTGAFQPVLLDEGAPESASRVLLCSGKVAHELRAERDKRQVPVRVVRVEELFPFPGEAIAQAVADCDEVVWVQEEPENMGGAPFVLRELQTLLGSRAVQVAARPRSASPATGSHSMHEHEQDLLFDRAFGRR